MLRTVAGPGDGVGRSAPLAVGALREVGRRGRGDWGGLGQAAKARVVNWAADALGGVVVLDSLLDLR